MHAMNLLKKLKHYFIVLNSFDIFEYFHTSFQLSLAQCVYKMSRARFFGGLCPWKSSALHFINH